MEKCFAGSASGANTETLSIVGNIVEVVVMVDYLTHRVSNGGAPIVFDAPGATDFFDVKGDRCEQFARFLKLKNAHVDQALIDAFCRQRKVRDGDKSMVPDIITHEGALREFYEVKPASTTGRRDGRQKIRNFCELNAGHGMPYCSDPNPEGGAVPRGNTYNPNYRRVFWRGQYSSIPAQVSLRFERDSDSLVLYRFCVEVTPEVVNETVLLLLVKAAIVTLILTRGAAIGVLVPAAAAYLLFMRSPLLGSVGQNGANGRADAKYAQRLLNQWRAPRGLPLLAVDGVPGNNTITAIRDFQRAEHLPGSTVSSNRGETRSSEWRRSSSTRSMTASTRPSSTMVNAGNGWTMSPTPRPCWHQAIRILRPRRGRPWSCRSSRTRSS